MPGRYDLAISRFGTMFFSDPVAANIASALRPAGRLALLVWQRREPQRMGRRDRRSARQRQPATRPPEATRSRSATPRPATGILERAGFETARFEDVREPVLYGHDIRAALEFVQGFQDASGAGEHESERRCRAVERLREILEAHYSDEQALTASIRAPG